MHDNTTPVTIEDWEATPVEILPHCQGYFEIQLEFAEKMAEIKGLEIEEVLREFTNIYRNLNINKSGEEKYKPSWADFMHGFHYAHDRSQWTYNFYLKHNILQDVAKKQYIGCFCYEYRSEPNAIRLHFENLDNGTLGPLSHARMEQRIKELRVLFSDARQKYPHAHKVLGESWLFNCKSYSRIFPKEYIDTAKEVTEDVFEFLALWGQFLDRNKQIKPDLATDFLNCIKLQTSVDGLKSCFPYKVLKTEASIELFYRFYGMPS